MIRIGLIGCGGIGGAHAKGWNAVDSSKARVVATADVDEKKAKEKAEQVGAKDYYTDYENILARDDIDAVDICVPNFLHTEITVKAAERKKHVLCEKPMTRYLDEGKEMLQVCKENNVILMIAHNRRFYPMHVKFKEMIDEGYIENVFLVRATLGFHPAMRWFDLKKDKLGGGVLISTGVHPIDLTRWFAGNVKRVSYAGNSLMRGMEGEDTAVMTLEFESGAIGTLVTSWAMRPGHEEYTLYGSNGALTTREGPRFIGIDGKVIKPELPGPVDSYHEEVEHFADCIINKTEPLISGEEGYEALKIVVAAYKSAEEGRIIALAEL